MFLLYIFILFHAVLAYDLQHKNKIDYTLEDAEYHFETFIRTYNKTYDECEKALRFRNFLQNLIQINEKNRKNLHSTFAINQFADLTSEEFNARHTGFRPNPLNHTGPCKVLSGLDLDGEAPDALDWREKIDITIKNQLSCACCWAFAATGNVEAQYAIRYNQFLTLSEQQLLDCDLADGGCVGGAPAQAFRYLIQAGGQAPDLVYPYVEKQQSCHFLPPQSRVRLSDCITFQLEKEDMIKEVLYKYGPVTTVIDSDSLIDYTSGVFSGCTFNRFNHAVLIVGYGRDIVEGKDFWVMKNSWGTEWGEKGFVRVERGINSCGLLNSNIATSIIV